VLAGLDRDGSLNPRPRVRVLHETDGAIHLDGDRGAGPGAPTRAMGWCIDRARQRTGMAVAAVRGWQLLVAAPYARLAAEAGLIGFACANFVPPVAPPGGRTAVLGTNPFAYGLPARRHHPVVLDVATTSSGTGGLLTRQRPPRGGFDGYIPEPSTVPRPTVVCVAVRLGPWPLTRCPAP
jgi:LDH2 family malate/lactate/ureidoglycolate dehydrogenase